MMSSSSASTEPFRLPATVPRRGPTAEAPPVVFIIGPPGAGKTTQSARLSQTWGLSRVSSGEILRQLASRSTPSALALRSTMLRGRLVDDDTVIPLVTGHLSLLQLQARGVVLDGFPRTLPQAHALDLILNRLNRVAVGIFLNAAPCDSFRRVTQRRVCQRCGAAGPEDALIQICPHCEGRLLRRIDDDPTTLEARLSAFPDSMHPVVEHYRRRFALRFVDGARIRTTVERKISSAITSKAARMSRRRV